MLMHCLCKLIEDDQYAFLCTQPQDAISVSSAPPSMGSNVDPRVGAPLQYTVAPSSISKPAPVVQGQVVPFSNKHLPQVNSILKPLNQVGHPEMSLQNSPAREEGEVPESELDPDTRRRLLILQHGQDMRAHSPIELQVPPRPSLQVSVPPVQGHGNWFPVDEEMTTRQLSQPLPPNEFPLQLDLPHIDKQHPHPPPFLHKVESHMPSARTFLQNQKIPKEVISIVLVYFYFLNNHDRKRERTYV